MLDKRLTKAMHINPDDHISVEKRSLAAFLLHAHEYYELEVIESGSGTLLLNGKKHQISRGSLYMLSPADFHEIVTKDRLTLWNISFDDIKVAAENELMLKTPLFSVIPEDNLLKFFKVAELLLLEHKTGKIPLSCCATYCLNSLRCVPTVWGFPPHKPSHTVCKDAFQRQPLAQRHCRTGRSVARVSWQPLQKDYRAKLYRVPDRLQAVMCRNAAAKRHGCCRRLFFFGIRFTVRLSLFIQKIYRYVACRIQKE